MSCSCLRRRQGRRGRGRQENKQLRIAGNKRLTRGGANRGKEFWLPINPIDVPHYFRLPPASFVSPRRDLARTVRYRRVNRIWGDNLEGRGPPSGAIRAGVAAKVTKHERFTKPAPAEAPEPLSAEFHWQDGEGQEDLSLLPFTQAPQIPARPTSERHRWSMAPAAPAGNPKDLRVWRNRGRMPAARSRQRSGS